MATDRPLDFLIAGVQKGGTTALWHFLSQHPAVCFGSKKELHFFDDERLDWSAPPYDALHAEFADAPPGSVCGDATPIYSYWVPSMARIAAYNPDIKLIFSFRDPVARAYSHWRMEVSRGAEQLSFSEAIREGRARVAREAQISGCHRVYSYVERGFYAEQLDRVFEHFPKEQVLLLRQADLDRDQAQVLDETFGFLGVAPLAEPPEKEWVFSYDKPEFAGISDEDRSFLEELYAPDRQRLKSEYGLDLSG
ncbi:sulfotransferase domain-containing protein [Methyloligella sp. 2.7D]|uniref:sulfotransferase domain-containing protein n=1 Tax=unclassified Methyloligella TaxID=2625955 RepID=UPI00157D7D1C|nr:sulfotransferase domain-containing protein [Methyloligella sp. GL2]QKP76338.1 sulfotransferase [Methyloligella sp. GL2]